jgi:hypothetical protein
MAAWGLEWVASVGSNQGEAQVPDRRKQGTDTGFLAVRCIDRVLGLNSYIETRWICISLLYQRHTYRDGP